MSEKTSLAPGGLGEVFAAFLKLGLSAFGGPIAHLGYFRDEFVVRRGWLDGRAYGDLIALCQFLPGPASSQVGFALGWLRAGPLGALVAWAAFTLPSAIALTLLALGLGWAHGAWLEGLRHGLQLVAVVIVAQALWSMARTLAPDLTRLAIAVLALAVLWLAPGSLAQIAAIGFGALAGFVFCRAAPAEAGPGFALHVTQRTAGLALAIFVALLLAALLAPVFVAKGPAAEFAAFYRSGALVFGGGHVVLPLLEAAVVDPRWVDREVFLSGYGAAQAMPGPLFAFAAFLGASMKIAPRGALGAALDLVAIFLPGMLVLLGASPFWRALRAKAYAQAPIRGVGAAVVGVLGAAFYNPVWTNAVLSGADLVAAAAGLGLLMFARAPPIAIVLLGSAFGVAQAYFLGSRW